MKAKRLVRFVVRCGLSVLAVGAGWAMRSYRAQMAEAGYSLGNDTMAVELHRRDVRRSPVNLHLMAISSQMRHQESSPCSGIIVHTVRYDEADRHDESYIQSLLDVQARYNYFTLGQACILALDGESSPRVESVLGMASEVYSDSYESDLLVRLSELQRGDEQARELFETIVSYVSTGGSGRLMPEYFSHLLQQRSCWQKPIGGTNGE